MQVAWNGVLLERPLHPLLVLFCLCGRSSRKVRDANFKAQNSWTYIRLRKVLLHSVLGESSQRKLILPTLSLYI